MTPAPSPLIEKLKRSVHPGAVIRGRYKLQEHLGTGSFGVLYRAEVLRARPSASPSASASEALPPHVALKFEAAGLHRPQLENEYRIYRLLKDDSGFARAYDYFEDAQGGYNCLVLQLMGASLEALRRRQPVAETIVLPTNGKRLPLRKFSLKTVLMIADQLLTSVEAFHRAGFVHRDIKPENVLVGAAAENRHLVHLVDLGIAKPFLDAASGRHVPYTEHLSLSGTARYCSVNSSIEIEQSRRDDVEGLLFVLLYLLNGYLKWQGCKAETQEKTYQHICARKLNLSVEEICDQAPAEFCEALTYCRGLRFDDRPDYKRLRRLFRHCARRHEFVYDYRYDWTLPPPPPAPPALEPPPHAPAAASLASASKSPAAHRPSVSLPELSAFSSASSYSAAPADASSTGFPATRSSSAASALGRMLTRSAVARSGARSFGSLQGSRFGSARRRL